MQLPIFFVEEIPVAGGTLLLPEEPSRHILTVLRMRENDRLMLTNGLGIRAEASIKKTGKKSCEVQIEKRENIERPKLRLTLAVSLLKNSSRFEWILEKATELGVHAIIPIICTRTERQHFRIDRMKNILVSAMLQSQQYWVPELSEPISIGKFFTEPSTDRKYIAHCLPGTQKMLKDFDQSLQTLMMIGPEGDFTLEEIDTAVASGFEPVSLGQNRLRTETAAIAAVSLILLG